MPEDRYAHGVGRGDAWHVHAHTYAHAALDATIFAAGGWPADLPDAEILARLLALNLQRPPA